MSKNSGRSPLKLAPVGFVLVLLLLATGCGGGQVGQAIQGVRNLEPEIEKRDQQVEELTRPSSGSAGGR